MIDAATWFARRALGAPLALEESAARYVALANGGGSVAAQLSEAAALALREVFGEDRSRATALVLLTADSLLTLALLAQAEDAPEDLECFATDIVGAAGA